MDESDEEPGFFKRHRVALIVAAVILVGGGVFFAMQQPKPKKRPSVSMVDIMPSLPPPPSSPPPTPPPTPPPQENEPEPQEKEEFQEEKQPEAAPPPEAPPAPAPAPMGTDLQGEGGPDFGLARGGGNGMIGGTGNGSGPGGGGTKFGWYAGQVQSTIVRALQSHKHTRSASLAVKARIWVDSSGRITRVTLAGTSGDPAVDRAIQSEVLNGLQLQEPPPADMPMPIVMRITAKRP